MKNLNTRTVPFVFSLRIFFSAYVIITLITALGIFYKPLFLSPVITRRLACSEISPSIHERKIARQKSEKWSDIDNLADGVTACQPKQSSVLCTLIEHALSANDSARYVRTSS